MCISAVERTAEMAITGLSTSETEEYISQHDTAKTEEDGATIWLLGALDAYTRARIGDNAMIMEQSDDGSSRFKISSGTRNLEAVKFALRGWRNFPDTEGNENVHKTQSTFMNGKTYQILTDELLNIIPQSIVNELGAKIIEVNSLMMEEEKNLKEQL